MKKGLLILTLLSVVLLVPACKCKREGTAGKKHEKKEMKMKKTAKPKKMKKNGMKKEQHMETMETKY